MKSSNKQFAVALRSLGFKATPARLKILNVLKNNHLPISAAQILKQVGGKADQATIYRSLESFVDKNLVKRVILNNDRAYYELARENHDHHHHLVCQECNIIEDVKICSIKNIESGILEKSKNFSAIKSHSLEFFGLCTGCSDK